MGVKEKVLKTDIPREKGYLYYVTTSPEGCLVISRTLMKNADKMKE